MMVERTLQAGNPALVALGLALVLAGPLAAQEPASRPASRRLQLPPLELLPGAPRTLPPPRGTPPAGKGAPRSGQGDGRQVQPDLFASEEDVRADARDAARALEKQRKRDERTPVVLTVAIVGLLVLGAGVLWLMRQRIR